MLNSIFKRVCENLIEISKHTGEQKERELNLFMSHGYLFLDLTATLIPAIIKTK